MTRLSHFDESTQVPSEPMVRALSIFWKNVATASAVWKKEEGWGESPQAGRQDPNPGLGTFSAGSLPGNNASKHRCLQGSRIPLPISERGCRIPLAISV